MIENIESVVAVVGAAAIVLIVWFWVAIGARMWRQRERNAFADKLARDEVPPKGPFAVYLRAFRHPAYVAIDQDLGSQLKTLIVNRHTGTDGRSGVRPLESVLAELLDKDMPLVGLGRPSAGLSKTGAGLVRTSDAEWKDLVTSLLDRCSLIVMTPAGTAGTAWEIEQLGQKPEWSAKTIYFMPNYHVELIRALQPFVVGHETMFGTSRFVAKKTEKPRPPGSIILYALSIIIVRAPLALALAFARCVADVAFAFVLLFQRFAKSFGLRGRWSAARRAGRNHGLAFPSYSAKGSIFVLDEHGKAHKLTDLHAIAMDDLKKQITRFAKEAEKRLSRIAVPEAAIAPTDNIDHASAPAPMESFPPVAEIAAGEADAAPALANGNDAEAATPGDAPPARRAQPEAEQPNF